MDAKEYAKHRNVSGAMVTKYLQQGMIPSAIRKGRKWVIDPEQADKDLADRLQIPDRKPNVQKLNLQTGHKQPLPSLAANRAIREMYAARITKLEFEERSRKLESSYSKSTTRKSFIENTESNEKEPRIVFDGTYHYKILDGKRHWLTQPPETYER